MKILNKFTYLNLKKNKKRTTVTIIGTMLAVTLLFVIGFIASSIRQTSLNDVIATQGNHHVVINNPDIDDKIYEIIKNNKKIDHFFKVEKVDKINNNYNAYEIKSASFNYQDNFILSDGRFPQNNNEIIIDYDLAKGNKIKLNDTFKNNEITYKVVGIYKESKFDHFIHNDNLINSTYTFYTKSEGKYPEDYYIYYKNIYDSISESYSIAEQAGFKINNRDSVNKYYNINLNIAYLTYFGIGDETFVKAISKWVIVLLGVLAFFASLAIYNAFSISISERKKLFGIFRSIGATKISIFLSVLFEAFIISIIAIPLGILLSVILILIASNFIDSLGGQVASLYHLGLYIYPSFMIGALIISILMIFVSALIPAIKASLSSPIDAIRLNKEVKIKKKKVKKSSFIAKVFGAEMLLANSNIKRDYKKYRSAKLSLIASIILFMVMGHFVNFLVWREKNELNLDNYYIHISITNNEIGKKLFNDIINYDEIKHYNAWREIDFSFENSKDYYTDEYKSWNFRDYMNNIISITQYDDKNYEELKKKYNVKNDVIFIGKNYINQNEGTYVKNDIIPKYNNNIDKIVLYKTIRNPEYVDGTDMPEFIIDYDTYYELDNIYLVDNKDYFGIVVNSDEFDRLYNSDLEYYYSDKSEIKYRIEINSKEYKKIDEKIQNLRKKYPEIETYTNEYFDIEDSINMVNLIIISYYSFLFFIVVIAITNIINTLNTSIDLRKRDFAVLRSIGLSKQGLNKTLFYEGCVLGFDSLVWGQVISTILIFLTMLANINSDEIIPYPYMYLIASIIGVYLIIFVSLHFASRKIKKSNIIETIRNDNI